MTIETTYSIGQECWLIHDNKVQKMQVVGINIKVQSGCIDDITYSLHNSSIMYSEDYIFGSKEALLQSL